jgi:site-specific recombinase XerD
MASVKIYLDKRSKKRDGTYPLKLTVSHQQKPFHVSLNVSIPVENWIDDKIEGDFPNKAFLNNYIKARLTGVENLLLRLKLNGTLNKVTPARLKQMILDGTDSVEEEKPETVTGENYLFSDHARVFMETIETEGTRKVYRYTLDTIEKHHDLQTLRFTDMDYNWLEDLDIKLRPTCKLNTRSIHFRNIRSIFRHAQKRKLLSKDIYPFDDFSIKDELSEHRDLSIEDLRLFRDHPVEPHQERYRDLFMLLFYLIGINLVDLLHVENIKNGRIEYRRAKTGRMYSVKLQPEAMEIINKYSPGEKYLLNFLDTYSKYEDFRRRFNKELKKIGDIEWIEQRTKTGRKVKKKVFTPLFPNLTSYYARHSWASIAAELEIPKETIQMALGHGARSVTDRYINFNMKKVDEANRKVIDYLNGNT